MRLKSNPAVKNGNLFHIAPNAITVESGYNVRTSRSFEGESFETLKASIAANGVRQPLIVRVEDDTIYLVSGHRRLAAALSLGHECINARMVPCIAESRGTTAADRIAGLVNDNSAEPLRPMEYAEACAKLRAIGETVDSSAARLGVSSVHIRMMLALADAPAQIREMVDAEKISPTLASETVAREGAEKAVAILLAAMAQAAANGNGKVTPKALRATADKSRRVAAAGNAKPERLEYVANKRSVFLGAMRLCIAENVAHAKIIAAALNKAQPAEYREQAEMEAADC